MRTRAVIYVGVRYGVGFIRECGQQTLSDRSCRRLCPIFPQRGKKADNMSRHNLVPGSSNRVSSQYATYLSILLFSAQSPGCRSNCLLGA